MKTSAWRRSAAYLGVIGFILGSEGSCSKGADTADGSSLVAGTTAPAAAPNAPREIAKETEPNDTKEQATLLPLDKQGEGYINEPTVVKKEKRADRDLWKFVIPAGSPKDVRIELSGLQAVDVALSLYKTSAMDEPVIRQYSNADSENEKKAALGEVISSVVLAPGEYIVRVNEFKRKASDPDLFDAANPYHLTITASDVRKGWEAEPNGKADANTLEVGTPMNGYLAWRQDEDWYALQMPQLPGPKILRLELQSPKDVRPTISIRNNINATLKAVSASQAGEAVVLPDYFVENPATPIYVVIFGHWDYDTANPYVLTATLTDPEGEWERESNDRTVQATPLPAGAEARIRGFIDAGRRLDAAPWREPDVDWFRFKFDEPKQINAVLSGIPDVDVILTAYDGNGERILLDVNDNGKKEGEIIPRVIAKEGFFLVSAGKNQFNANAPYELVVRASADDLHTEREPDNSSETATTVVPGDTVPMNGWIHPKKDVDFYRIDLSKEEKRAYRLEVTGIALIEFALSVLDETGKEVAKVQKKKDLENAQLETELAPGIYFVRVADVKGTHSNPENSYSLSVAYK